MAENENEKIRIIPVNIEDEMKSSYIDYSMSVIVARALPDVRDGLKPVHRRILYGMEDLGLRFNKAHKKSARIVGEVLGKYHPHGDGAVYDAMVRMAQDWSLRYPLVDGQGNFGSMDGDSPAAMRYTEARLAKISDRMLDDIKKETVDFRLNFDDSLEEPTILPTRIPNLLVNGASGIAVGMATNMLPHNLSDVVDATIAMIDNKDITVEELIEFVKAPDFPTGGIIYGVEGVRESYHTGRGRVVVRGRAEIVVSSSGKEQIIISEIPFQVNKANLIIKIADLVNEEKISGISDVRDESDKDGLRIVVDLKRDAMGSVVLSKLYKYSPLQTSYGVNNIALVNGRPKQLNIQEMLKHFIDFRQEVVQRRTRFDLRKAEERAHILEGLLIALDNLDAIIALIRASRTVDIAKEGLMSQFKLSELQAKAILEMRLQKLTGLEREKIKTEYDELQEKIAHYNAVLSNEEMQFDIIKDELREVKEEFGDERRTSITYSDGEISIEDMIPNDEVVVTISHLGYIKRTKVDEYRVQSRGGKGAKGSKTREKDFIEHMIITSNHNYILLFTEGGQCFWLRVYEIPEGSKTSTGRVIQNIIQIPKDDMVKAIINIENLTDEEYINNHYLVFATKKGRVVKNVLEAYSRPRTNGIKAISTKDGDQLLEVKLTDGNSSILLASRKGKSIHFDEKEITLVNRGAMGVKGMTLSKTGDDQVIGMIVTHDDDLESSVLVLSENGLGKRSQTAVFSPQSRGGKGKFAMKITEKTGDLVALKYVTDLDDLMITSKEGIMIRMHVNKVPVLGRATQGVKLIRLDKKDSIADVAVVRRDEDSDEEE